MLNSVATAVLLLWPLDGSVDSFFFDIVLLFFFVDSVEAAFYLCSYEFTILKVNSPWCQLFDEVDAQVLEQKVFSCLPLIYLS